MKNTSSQVLFKQTNKDGTTSAVFPYREGYSPSVVIITTKPGSKSMTTKPVIVPKEKMRETLQKIYEGIPLDKGKKKRKEKPLKT